MFLVWYCCGQLKHHLWYGYMETALLNELLLQKTYFTKITNAVELWEDCACTKKPARPKINEIPEINVLQKFSPHARYK